MHSDPSTCAFCPPGTPDPLTTFICVYVILRQARLVLNHITPKARANARKFNLVCHRGNKKPARRGGPVFARTGSQKMEAFLALPPEPVSASLPKNEADGAKCIRCAQAN